MKKKLFTSALYWVAVGLFIVFNVGAEGGGGCAPSATISPTSTTNNQSASEVKQSVGSDSSEGGGGLNVILPSADRDLLKETEISVPGLLSASDVAQFLLNDSEKKTAFQEVDDIFKKSQIPLNCRNSTQASQEIKYQKRYFVGIVDLGFRPSTEDITKNIDQVIERNCL